MATGYTLENWSELEEGLKKEKAELQRELHMHNVRRLYKKQEYLAKEVVQRKQIEALEKRISELEPLVSTLYCPQHVLKDNEIKGYLVYLLKMRDFFAREIATKEESINQLDFKIEMKFREICAITREQAKEIKNKPKHSPEFIRLENMSNRLEQMNKRICTMRKENREIMESIIDMRKFQKQFKTFESEFRRKINYFKNRGQKILETAVALYEEKDEFMAKQKVSEKRHSQDLRKTAIHENVLNLCLRRTEKNEAFAELQAKIRIDTRLAEASDMIEERVTGLEPTIEKMDKLQTTISEAAGKDTPEKMEENFRVTSENIDISLSYLDELLKDINRLQGEINSLKKIYNRETKNIRSTDTKFCMEIKGKQDIADKWLEAAYEASNEEEEAKSDLNTTLDVVKSLYATCCPDDALSLEQTPIDETNIIDYLQEMEKQLLNYLICHEYIKMKEASKETKPVLLETDKDEDIEDEVREVEHEDILKPRDLSDTDLLELEPGNFFLHYEELQDQAMDAVYGKEPESSDDETSEYF